MLTPHETPEKSIQAHLCLPTRTAPGAGSWGENFLSSPLATPLALRAEPDSNSYSPHERIDGLSLSSLGLMINEGSVGKPRVHLPAQKMTLIT